MSNTTDRVDESAPNAGELTEAAGFEVDGGDEDWSQEKARRLDALLASVESKLTDDKFRASVGDFVRLLQLRKEIEDERPREVTVRWVEPSEAENAPAK